MSDDFEVLLHQASQPSVEILEQLSQGASGCVQAMLDEIGKKFWTPRYTVAKLKKKLGVNYGLLCRFRAAVGLNPGRLIRECRMETAMRLLRDTLLPVDEIAILIGFDYEGSLARLCRRWCGLNPSELRDCLRPVKDELRELPYEVFSWYFWEQYHCNALSDEELRPVIEYLEQRRDTA